jgi:DnaJ-class molecular chaperone
MICSECSGNGFIKILGASPNNQETEINCPTCEGDGELPDTPAAKHCPACGEPIAADRDWCDEHKGAALVGESLG